MEDTAEWLEELVLGLGTFGGGVGLFVIAFFDSSLVSLPEVNDVLLVYYGAELGTQAYLLALMTVLGSASGCSVLYSLARWKGYGFLKKRFPEGRLARVFSLVQRYGALAVIVPAVLPPPFPFKIFVLSSGALGLSFPRFIMAVLVGRSVRYFGETFLAIRYGERAFDLLRANAGNVFLAVLVLVAVGLVVLVALRARGRTGRSEGTALDAGR